MGPFDSCRLIHKNLASYVVNKFTKNAHIDEELLYKHSYEAVRLADDLIDLELEAIQAIIDKVSQEGSGDEIELWTKIKETTISGRRAGLGFTGLADVIAMMGLRYDSDEGIALVDKLMKIQFKAELDCQVDLAIERGRFPGYDPKLEEHNPWIIAMSKEFPEEIARMNKYSRRNLSWSTVAPTGTASLMSQTSAGVEPVFLPFYNRKRKCMSETDRVDFVDKVGEKYTLFPVVHKGLKDWAKIALNIKDDVVDSWTLETWEKQWKKSPYYKSTSPEINWRQRVLMQSTIQKYITHSISSTVNLAEETTQQEIQDLYVEAWKHGLKGITIYRDKCRDGILTKVEKPTILENRRAPKRPVDLEAECHVIRSGGEQFIIIVGLFDGKPYEVFAFKPIIELKLAKHKGIITKVSKMHYRFESEVLKLDNLGSISNSVEEEAATLYSSMLLRHGVPIEYITKTAKKVNSNITSFSSAMCRVLSSYIGKKEVKGEVCPECGGTLVRDNGCIHCLDCCWSRCL